MIFVDDSRDVAFIDGNLRVYWRGVDLTDRYTDVELKEFEQVMREEGVEPFAAEESESA